MLTPPLPGHHRQVPVADGFAANVDATVRILSEMRPVAERDQPVHLAGYSLGARVALGLAIRHPRLVARLTLIGVHPGIIDPAERARRIAADGKLAELLRARGIEAFVSHWQSLPIFASQARAAPAALASQRAIRLGRDPAALADSLAHLGLGAMPDYRPHFAELAMPVTVIVGAEDGKFLALAHQLVEIRPATQLRIIAGCGHNPVLERPEALASSLVA